MTEFGTTAPPLIGPSAGVDRPALSRLRRALARARNGNATAVLIRGGTDTGKSELLHSFVAELAGDPGLLVLEGHCHPAAGHAYQALHHPMSQLAELLGEMSHQQLRALALDTLSPLTHMFPVLLRVAEIAAARPTVSPPLELGEAYRLALAALRTLLSRLANLRPVVLAIDDLQWADADSGALIAEMLRPPDAPALLLCGTYRDADPPPPLVRALSRRGRTGAAAVEEIVLPRADPSAATAARSRIDALSQQARALIAALAVAGRPISSAVAARAAHLADPDRSAAWTELERCQLLGHRHGHDRRLVSIADNVFHDAVLESMTAEETAECHLALALEYQASGLDDPAALAEHYAAAGEAETACRYAARAATRANHRLAFAHAARLYRWAIELGRCRGKRRSDLEIALADTLAAYGPSRAAADAYLAAIAGLPVDALPGTALSLRQRAADQLLGAGEFDAGLATLTEVLATVDLRLSTTRRAALATLAARRAQLRLRGTRFVARAPAEIPLVERRRLEVCWEAARGLVFVDNLRAAVFHMRHLGLALDAGDPSHIARGMAMEGAFLGIFNAASRARAVEALNRAAELADAAGDPVAQAFVAMCSAVGPAYAGHWRRAREEWRRAAAMLRDYGGGGHELVYARVWLQVVLFYLGELAELSQRVGAMVASGADDHHYAAMGMSTGHANFVWLCRDDPEGARAAADRVSRAWDRNNHLVHYDLLAHTHIDLYQGDARAAWARTTATWRRLGQAGLLRLQRLRVEARHLRACAGLAMAAASDFDPTPYLRQVDRDATRMERERIPWATALARLIRAGAAVRRGDRAAAKGWLRAAETSFERSEMALHLAVTRRRYGELIGGQEGARMIARSDAWMRRQRIAVPDRIADVIAPGIAARPELTA